jgi:hypothetical protein
MVYFLPKYVGVVLLLFICILYCLFGWLNKRMHYVLQFGIHVSFLEQTSGADKKHMLGAVLCYPRSRNSILIDVGDAHLLAVHNKYASNVWSLLWVQKFLFRIVSSLLLLPNTNRLVVFFGFPQSLTISFIVMVFRLICRRS